MKHALFAAILFLTACTPMKSEIPQEAAPPPVVSVYASPTAEPWLEAVYACAAEISVVIRLSVSQSAADIRLRLGEPPNLTTPAYQIGAEDVLVVTHPQNPLADLTMEDVRRLFAEGGENVEVWVYASGGEVQELFEREVMHGTRIHALARLALHPEQMLESLERDSRAVGLLPRRWLRAPLREAFALRDVPVLAITPGEPQGAVKELIACLQQRKE
ncbi:MAG: hypothetical protein DDG60_16895 [Anaerolineae bacterium]|nr:MAG: hypothetical protein DDG60_16895 [Anaerolineae bacterium]